MWSGSRWGEQHPRDQTTADERVADSGVGILRGELFTVSAERVGNRVLFTLTDPAARRVADGLGATVREAQEDALRNTTDEDAQRYLERITFPEELADHDAT